MRGRGTGTGKGPIGASLPRGAALDSLRRRASGALRDSLRIGSIFGIEIRLHFIFLLILVGFPANEWWTEGLAAGLDLLARLLILFGCVLLHELGHSVVALRQNVHVRDILLWPLGGVARLERLPDSPRSELLIAVAGPAVNFAILVILLPLLLGRDAAPPSTARIEGAPTLLEWLAMVNVAMGTFNLIPAFPLDGGRVLRALLARRLGIVKATCAAVMTGRLFASIAVIAALCELQLAWLAVLAAFVWIVGGLELKATLQRRHADSWYPEAPPPLSGGDIARTTWKNAPS